MKTKPVSLVIRLLVLSGLVLVAACQNSKTPENGPPSTSPAAAPLAVASPYADYNATLKAQAAFMQDFAWPPVISLDLNDDGKPENFLAVEAYARGASYALYTPLADSWACISSSTIPSGHLEIALQPETNQGWHDFTALQPLGRDNLLLETRFHWNNGYQEIASTEVDPAE